MYRPILASGALLAAKTPAQACRAAPSHFTPDVAFCPEHTRDGYLPPWEVAKAAALDSVISDMERHLGKSCWELLGRGKVPYIVGRLALKGDGQPQDRAVRKLLAKCRKIDWFTGKQPENVDGRPPAFSDHAKQEARLCGQPPPCAEHDSLGKRSTSAWAIQYRTARCSGSSLTRQKMIPGNGSAALPRSTCQRT